MNRMLWIQRRFAFDFPAEHTPEILERLRGTPARLEERLGDVADEQLRRRPAEGWSIQEHAGHLIKVEALFAGRLEDYSRGLAELRPADMSNRSTFEADYNSQELTDIFVGFRGVRGDFLDRLAAMDPGAPTLLARHPRLETPMRLCDMLFFMAEHDDYHLARIGELIAAASR
jgi:uncharacterized damage-inducible protein DinB